MAFELAADHHEVCCVRQYTARKSFESLDRINHLLLVSSIKIQTDADDTAVWASGTTIDQTWNDRKLEADLLRGMKG